MASEPYRGWRGAGMSDANQKFKWLRSLGDWGGHAADLLAFFSTNWQFTLATILAVGTGLNHWAWGLAVTPAVYASVGVFLAILWTVVGLTYLFDRRKPRQITAHLDYRYGLTFVRIVPQFIASDSGFPQAGCVAFGVELCNYSPGPIYYRVEAVDMRLSGRTTPKYKANAVYGYMARGAGRTSTPVSFEAKEIKDFYGAGITEGTADVSITYGPPDQAPIRRLKISVELSIALPIDGKLSGEPGHQLGFNFNIASEEDVEI
jgi:hypothetical protein